MPYKISRFTTCGLLACAAIGSSQGYAGPVVVDPARSASIELGTSYDLPSKVLRETRVVNVVLPASYRADTKQRYPVLYLLDGGMEQDLLHVSGAVRLGAIWGRSDEAIVVGIRTNDRRKELVGPTADPELLKRFPTAGSSARFREYIRTEVKPLVERLYRTNGRDMLLGESLAGLFVIETFLTEPTLFDAYGAVDPSLWWDHGALAKAAVARLNGAQRDQPLLVAAAKEQLQDPDAYQRLVAALRGARATICLVPRADLTHATIYQQITPAALQYLLPPKEPPRPESGFVEACSAN